MAQTKVCRSCGASKPVDQFPAERRRCKECHRAHRRGYLYEYVRKPEVRLRQRLRRQRVVANPLLGPIFKKKESERRKRKAAQMAAYAAEWNRRPDVQERKRSVRKTAEFKIKKMAWDSKRRGAVGSIKAEDITRILVAQRYKCAICRRSIRDGRYHLDHIIPIVNGGSNWPRNIQMLCPPCNLSKWANDPIDYMQKIGLLL